MNSLIYSEKLQDPHWQRKRLEILSRDKFTCQLCQDTETTLHVHHKEYLKGHQPWEYPDDNFQTLCKDCHLVVEYFKLSNEKVLTCMKPNKTTIYYLFVAFIMNIEWGITMVALSFLNNRITIEKEIPKIVLDQYVQVFKLGEEKILSINNG